MSTISPFEMVDLIAGLKTRHSGLELKLCDASAPTPEDQPFILFVWNY
jgi:hypothetical protein